ncbi:MULTISPECIES: oligosaccharide flippase family protein [Niastella]|uniref:Oligosaccharide flippase family protein n=1 Tax=Niastella soli TaxID=2821487 RepID=A0ABS3YMD2_9BACT|nr:oligosaccharide flippase family protein [Niastella soli]MBO9199026.1 oligosaccharide flippase family protein [Niastella soli]
MEESHSRRSRIFSNFLALGILQGTNFLLPVLVMPFVIKRIGADGYGIVAVAQVVLLIFCTVSDYGFNLTATRALALHRDDITRNARLFFTVLAAKMVICLGLFAVLLLLISLVPFFKSHFQLYLFGFTWVLGQSLLVSWFFQGVEKMKYITIYTLLARLLFVALVFAFIRQRSDYRFFILFMGAGSVVAGISSIFQALWLYKLPMVRPMWRDIVNELKEGWPVMLSNISINTFLSINVFILRLFTNDLITGYYSVAEKVFLATRQVPVMFSQVIYPPLCQLLQKGKEATRPFFRSVYVPFLLLMLLACVLLFSFSAFIISFFLGSNSGNAVLLLRLFCLGPIIVCLHIPASQLLMAANHKKSYLRVLTWGTLLNVICNFLLVQVWGPVGTAISVLLTELFITVGFNRELFINKLSGYVSARVNKSILQRHAN